MLGHDRENERARVRQHVPGVSEQREAAAPHPNHDLDDHEHGRDPERDAERALRTVLVSVPMAVTMITVAVVAMTVASVTVIRRIVLVRGAHLGSKAPTRSVEKCSANCSRFNDILASPASIRARVCAEAPRSLDFGAAAMPATSSPFRTRKRGRRCRSRS